MLASMRFYGVAVAAMLAASPGCQESPGFSMLGGGSGSTVDGYSFSAGGIFLEENEPGVLFGTQKMRDGYHEFTYFVIFRHAIEADRADREFSVSRGKGTTLSFDGSRALMTDGITIDGNSLRLELQLQVDRAAGTVQTTEFSVNGSDTDPSEGALILVDLSSRPVTYTQVNARLPDGFADPLKMEPADVRNLALDVTQKLRTENADVWEFFRK